MAIPFKYNGRSLLLRRVSNSMTAGAIALVVASGLLLTAILVTVRRDVEKLRV